MIIKKAFNLAVCLVLVGLLIQKPTIAQGVFKDNIKDYIPIQSSGKIPSLFLTSVEENYSKDINALTSNIQEETDVKKEYYLKTHNWIHDVLISGNVLFNDPLSGYVNKVVSNIKLKNSNKFEDIDVYLLKSPMVNASATGAGIVFVNVGTLAYIENEAQLAFILCHEFSHIYNKDNLEGFLETDKILEGKGIYSSVSFDDRIDMMFMHRKEIEFAADSTAIGFYLNAGYDLDEIPNAFDIIHYSYMPFFNEPFPIDFFNIDDFEIPKVFFKQKIDTISSMQNYKDAYHSHPNIYKRKQAITEIIQHLNDFNTKKFINKIDEFKLIREIARFEVVRLHLLYKNYSDAIYSAVIMLEKYPNNSYLQKIIAKSLYGLSKYRNSDESHLVIKSYSRVEGESQQVHYLFRQLKKEQLNVLAIKYVCNLIEVYEEDIQLKNIRDDLIKDLVYYHHISLNDFYDEPIKDSLGFNYSEKKDLLGTDLIDAQRKVETFYLNAFCEKKDDTILIQVFSNAEIYFKEQKNYDEMTAQEKMFEERHQQYFIRSSGVKCDKGKALLMEPYIIYLDKKHNEEILDAEYFQIDLNKKISNLINKKHKENIIFISSLNMNNESIDSYNKMCVFKEMYNEILTKNKCTLIPLSNDYSNLAKNMNVHIVCIPIILKLNNDWYYIMHFYDTYQGQLVYEMKNDISVILSSSNKVCKLIKKDLLLLNF